MVLLQIHSKLNVCNFVGMHLDLTFLSYIFRGLLFPDTVYNVIETKIAESQPS